ncbi:hypothetical protein B0H13DRAFT_2301039 [Mycena leptocephala]|nr:hypothetical protein B0H13DRAFT_2301039 [Mycena leptocephala]
MATPRAKCAALGRSSRNLRIRPRLLPPPRAASLSTSGTPQTAALPVKRSVPPPQLCVRLRRGSPESFWIANGHVETVPTTRSYNAHVPIVAMQAAGCLRRGRFLESQAPLPTHL